MRLAAVACVVIALASSAQADDATQRHLLAGVRAFKAHDYELALVELRVVQRSPDAPADLAFYLGPTLVKLGRDREAIDVFVTSKAPSDALSDFFLGEAYYHARLYRKARALFADLRTRGLGPALDEAAERYVTAVDVAYSIASGDAVIDAYVSLASDASEDAVFAAQAWDEARLIDAMATQHAHHAEIVGALVVAWGKTNPKGVIAVLSAEPARDPEQDWQLARAYRAVGDAEHARPLLEAIARGSGAHAAEAAGMLAPPPP